MTKRLIPVILLTFVNYIGFSILFPVLVFIVDGYGGGPLVYGILLSAYSIFQFIATPLIGSLSDKYGRRPTLLLSQAGTLLSWCIFGLAYFLPNIPIGPIALPLLVILIARIADGITGGNLSVANAYVADITKPEERTKAFGLIGAAIGLGFMIGPALGGYAASFSIGYLGTVIAAASISVITFFAIQFFLTESLPPSARDKHLEIKLGKELNIWKRIRSFKDNKKATSLFGRRLYFSLAMAAFTSTFALYAKDILFLTERSLGILMLFIGIFAIFNQAYLAPKLAARLGDKKTFNIGQLILAASIALIALKPDVYWFTALMYFANLGISTSMPTFRSMLTRSVDKSLQGRISGIDESIMAGSNGAVPLLATAAYAAFSYSAYAIFALILLVPFIKIGKRN